MYDLNKYELDLELLIQYEANKIETAKVTIRRARREAGFTIQQVAKAVELSRATISRYENGRAIIPLSYLEKLNEFINKEN